MYRSVSHAAVCIGIAISLSACSQGAGAPAGSSLPANSGLFARAGGSAVPGTIGLGKILTTKDGGQIYGFDVNQNGTDGILASAADTSQPGVYKVSVETFDQNTGKITKSFASSIGKRNSYALNGIYMGDVALVTHFVTPKGTIYATRKYRTVAPVTAGKFTGNWTPSIADVNVQSGAENQTTSTAVLFAIELKNQDKPDLFVSDVAANTFSNVIHLDPNLFGGGNGPQLGQYTAANEAVFALSPDGGRVGGVPPVNVLINLQNGNQTKFNGYNNGPFHAGYVNGLAVDPNTGVAATTTELNAQVEFYDLNTEDGNRRRPVTLHRQRQPEQQRRGDRGRPRAQAVSRHGSVLLQRKPRQRAGRLRRTRQSHRDDHRLHVRDCRTGAGAQSDKAHGMGVRAAVQPTAAVLLLVGATHRSQRTP